MPVLSTIGHSNKSLADFIPLLRQHGVLRILDVRRYPASRKWPHFDAAALAEGLAAAGIDYQGLPELGGRRKPLPDSPHTAWREEGFRGFADFMDTPDFAAGLARACALAAGTRSALLCAEALPWRCHRSLIADAFLARGWEVCDIVSAAPARPHRLPDFARVEGGRVIYDGKAEDLKGA
ncbi:MAG: DUF488 domain-containing protein [Acidobacteriota bacterium]